MAKKIIKAQMKQRQDTKANWAAANPVLLDGELGMVSDDRNLYKVGDGRTAWNDLPFRGFDGTLAQELGTSANAAISQKAVTEKLTELSDKAIQGNGLVNLFNKETATDGYYVTPDGLDALSGWSASDYIPVKPNTTYSATLISNSRYYDVNKNYISAIPSSPFTTPSNAAYIRLSLYTDMKDEFMVNEGSELKEYEPYGNFLPISAIDSKVVGYLNQELGIDEIRSEIPKDYIKGEVGSNLFNKGTATDGYFVGPNGLDALSGWSASDYIPVKPNTTYSATLISNSRYYDANKNDIGTIPSSPFTTPSNAAYIRLSLYTDMKDSFMLNEGAELKEYAPYGNFLPISSIGDDVTKYLKQELGVSNIKSELDTLQTKSDSIETSVDKIKETCLMGVQGANLFNKETATDGYYVTPDGLGALTGWSASDYIPVKPNTTYSATLISNSCYYDSNKNYLSNITSATFTTPSNAAYIRLSLYTDMKDEFMVNEGAELKEYEPYGNFLPISAISPQVIEYLDNELSESNNNQSIPYFNRLRAHLDNPFIRTQIKLIGDSITAGMGGTGFSPSGETIKGGELGNANVLSATCWANMFYHYINDRYNKDVNVLMNDSNIETPYINQSSIINAEAAIVNNKPYQSIIYTLVENNTVAGREFCKFSFYGNHIAICIQKSPISGGIFEVIVDDSLVKTIDCYASEESYLNNVVISLSSEKQHDVILRCTGRKNAASTYSQIRINGLVIPKTAIVKPWGVSGTTSELIKNKSGYISSEDDFVIAQFGTNDRHIMFSPSITENNLIEGCNNIINEYNALPILMCAPPTSEYHNSEFAEGGYYFTMNEVHDAIASVADKFNMPYIDNYTAMQDYADEHNITTDDLLSDGLHPNDLGYQVIFTNIMRCLGLARRPYYNEWKGTN